MLQPFSGFACNLLCASCTGPAPYVKWVCRMNSWGRSNVKVILNYKWWQRINRSFIRSLSEVSGCVVLISQTSAACRRQPDQWSHMWKEAVQDIIILADMEEGSVYVPKSINKCWFCHSSISRKIVIKGLMWCYCSVLTLGSSLSMERMFLMLTVIRRSVWYTSRSFVKTSGPSYLPDISKSKRSLVPMVGIARIGRKYSVHYV